jgi:hypothetical protein
MEDLERLETERYGVFTLAGVITLVALVFLRRELNPSVPSAIGLGLLCGGLFVAWRTPTERVAID